ncbi:B3 domain-containing protein Os01g0234100-like [Prosopis cineraria]|uniref:B3 domain-containing protein Os01g0234100-like n=1 Tax=Prosopis cineraria TaxID=364024 RepID=UPI002410A173|nr:B3 domain-containing protein Os01g0234100-like [Prosopis cineraria]
MICFVEPELSCLQKKDTSKKPSPLRIKRSTFSQSEAFNKAKEIQQNLSQEHPSVIKSMLPSHGLPKRFCEMHLPKADTMVVLEDENGREYETKYLIEKMGLSGGWRGFSIAHNLLEGDVLVFHLIEPLKFKVYIIRSHNGSTEEGHVLRLPYLDGSTNQRDSNVHQEGNPDGGKIICDASMPPSNQYENNDLDENLDLEVLNDNRISKSPVTFQNVTSIENFSIVVNGLVLDSELSEHLKAKYYKLCCSQEMFLHENLLENQNCQLVVGIICETINIADAIKASKITTPLKDFAVWHKSLKGLEWFGMNVRFLLDKLEQLMDLASRFERHAKARSERDQAKEEKKLLELKLKKVKETLNKLDSELDSHNMNLERLEAKFQDLADTAW